MLQSADRADHLCFCGEGRPAVRGCLGSNQRRHLGGPWSPRGHRASQCSNWISLGVERLELNGLRTSGFARSLGQNLLCQRSNRATAPLWAYATGCCGNAARGVVARHLLDGELEIYTANTVVLYRRVQQRLLSLDKCGSRHRCRLRAAAEIPEEEKPRLCNDGRGVGPAGRRCWT